VIEFRGRAILLPAAGVVTGFASSANLGVDERALVRIVVAVLAACKLETFVFEGCGACRRMALLTGDRLMQSG
jgi:hypothetical protein